jgi:mitochondrial protein MBA1
MNWGLGTIVMPTGSNKPPIFSRPMDWAKLQYLRAGRRMVDLIQTFLTKWQLKTKIHFRKIAPSAVALHRQMYTAFAE